MKRNTLIILSLATLFLSFSSVSCNYTSEKSSKNKLGEIKTDTLWNDNIQGVFFETPFGASKKQLIKNFRTHGLQLISYASTDNLLHFISSKGKYKSFGGMNWEMVDAKFNNKGKFVSILFMNAGDDKASALQDYNNLFSTISKKYQLTEIQPIDTTLYAASAAYSKSKRMAGISCFRYESIGEEIKIGVSLQYIDYSFEDEVSDEL